MTTITRASIIWPRAVLALASVMTLAWFTPQTALAAETTIGSLTISEPWSRATPPAVKVAAGYATIRNGGESDDRLVGATTDIAERVEIHRTEMDDGVMRMRPLKDGLAVPAGETVTLEPGGLHLMFIGLLAPVKEGVAFPVTLTFEQAGEVALTVMPAGVGAPKPSARGSHSGGNAERGSHDVSVKRGSQTGAASSRGSHAGDETVATQ